MARKNKIAYILTMAKRGIPAFTYREIDILIKNGFEISIFPLIYKPGPFMPNSDWYCYIYNPLLVLLRQPFYFLRWPRRYMELLGLSIRTHSLVEFIIATDYASKMHKRGIEHIHCHFGDRKLRVGYYVKRLLGLPLTVTVHAYEIYNNRCPKIFNLSIAACDWIVVQSNFNAEKLRVELGIPKEKIRLVRAHGDLYDAEVEKAVKLLIVAEFREKKGYDVLFDALAMLNRDDWILWVVGEGPDDVHGLAKRAGLENKIQFFGMLPGNLLNILYNACDIFVLPSKTAKNGDREGIPAVLMEVMSQGKPVISTKHAGIPELVSDILIEENDAKALAQAIEMLMSDPEKRREMGLRNREIVKSMYSKANVIDLGRLFTDSTPGEDVS